MSYQNYITNILNLKEKNLVFKESFYKEEIIKGINHKVFEAFLSYQPTHCPKCDVLFDDDFEKHGFINSNIKIPDVSGFKSILKLHKQRYLCKHCNKAFTLSTNIVNYGCCISNNTKHKIAHDLVKKRSEKDIALDNNVSPNTVKRVMDSYYESQKLYKHYLPEVLSFDELKNTYLVYQDLLYALKHKNYNLLVNTLNSAPDNISSYMKTSVNTLLDFLPFIKNTFAYNYYNGFIKGNNNFIKVLKRIAFGFRSFRRFKARIMICKGLLKIKKIANA